MLFAAAMPKGPALGGLLIWGLLSLVLALITWAAMWVAKAFHIVETAPRFEDVWGFWLLLPLIVLVLVGSAFFWLIGAAVVPLLACVGMEDMPGEDPHETRFKVGMGASIILTIASAVVLLCIYG